MYYTILLAAFQISRTNTVQFPQYFTGIRIYRHVYSILIIKVKYYDTFRTKAVYSAQKGSDLL